MALLQELEQRLKHAYGTEAAVHRECRRCGTTVTPTERACPACGSGEISELSL
ncbi:hypothetical protein [Natranaeroarchaeum aerophilus]|uniref:Zinc-ribbon domain-containing protein n=1 Tax=Natranaeroarchaeum aerophilus TaxID=2917711 RepID=A0AAE3FSC3_9EURY|nr:hypothetical protein [Natranaeroarchaeum aerophilus]MCL9813634.1 hypothetical protein [Natranaeroarchaeum aerophilus]